VDIFLFITLKNPNMFLRYMSNKLRRADRVLAQELASLSKSLAVRDSSAAMIDEMEDQMRRWRMQSKFTCYVDMGVCNMIRIFGCSII
jgi:hypothetical protein